MTNEVKIVLEKIKNNDLFDNDLYFVGGTALSHYLDHRVSYDIDIASSTKLPISKIKSFAFSIGAKQIRDANGAQFKINNGVDIENFHMKFILDGIKIEFSHFRLEMQKLVFQNARSSLYESASKLKILELNDIVLLKIIALFNRQKTRDLFDAAIILQTNLLDLAELERIYSFSNHTTSLRDYINGFNSVDDDLDNTIDFLAHHTYYKKFKKLDQHKRFKETKSMFIHEYDKKQKEAMLSINRAIRKG